jgi:hypothetical protein
MVLGSAAVCHLVDRLCKLWIYVSRFERLILLIETCAIVAVHGVFEV